MIIGFIASFGIKAILKVIFEKLIKMYLNPDFIIRILICWFGKYAKSTKTKLDDMAYNHGIKELEKSNIDVPCTKIVLEKRN